MIRESLTRKFHPAGFEQPEGSRREYVRPRDELQKLFYKWFEGLCNDYPYWEEGIREWAYPFREVAEEEYIKACELVKHLGEIPYIEVNSLLIDFEPKSFAQQKAGLFLSACYNKSPQQVIVFGFNAPQIWYIGYKLERGKILVNNGEVGQEFGALFPGVVINNGDVAFRTHYNPLGIIVNNGIFECCISDVITPNFEIGFRGQKGAYGYLRNIKKFLELADFDKIPELKKYFKNLRELSKSVKDKESTKNFLERYGSEPKERIEQDIEDILKKGGFEI